MNISKLHEHYSLNDGTIKSFHLDIQNNTAEIELLVSKNGTEKEQVPCTLKLTFRYLIEVSLFDKFPTDGYFLQFVTFRNGGSEVGVSINVYDNSSFVHEKPNWVIKAKRVLWEEI